MVGYRLAICWLSTGIWWLLDGNQRAIGWLSAGYQLAIGWLPASYRLSISWPWAGNQLSIAYPSAGYGLAMGYLSPGCLLVDYRQAMGPGLGRLWTDYQTGCGLAIGYILAGYLLSVGYGIVIYYNVPKFPMAANNTLDCVFTRFLVLTWL